MLARLKAHGQGTKEVPQKRRDYSGGPQETVTNDEGPLGCPPQRLGPFFQSQPFAKVADD